MASVQNSPNFDAVSPMRKRIRYTSKTNDKSCWTLTHNEIILDEIQDSGLEGLDNICNLNKSIGKLIVPIQNECKKDESAKVKETLSKNAAETLSNEEINNLLKVPEAPPIDNTNYFDYLSDEVILNIFSRLRRNDLCIVALVCKRFHLLIEDESLWTRMDVSNQTLAIGGLGRIMSRQVIILRLANSSILFPPILNNVKASLPNFTWRLMYLDLTLAAVSTKTLKIIFHKCTRLKKLSLESVPIDDNVLMALSGNRDLEILNLTMSNGVALDGLKYLLANCRNLKEINFSWTYMNADCISYICDNLPSTLDRLNLAGCRKLLHDSDVANLVRNCGNLRELDLSDCTAITGESVRQITNLDELNFLALSRCYGVPYRSLIHLRKMSNLLYLDVHGNYTDEDENLQILRQSLGYNVNINKFKFSSVARPTVAAKKSTIWNMKLRN